MLKYDLDKLGCVDFEGLCQTLLKARLGMGIEAWGGSGDWGCDSFSNDWLPYPTRTKTEGPFVFQAKFVVAANAAGAKPEKLLLSAIDKECERITLRLAPTAKRIPPKWRVTPRHYILLTNSRIGPALKEKIQAKIKLVLPMADVHVHGGTDICMWVTNHPEIIPAFPQLLTISDWTAFVRSAVNAGVYERSKTAISLAQRDARVFVPTAPYYRAQEKLRKHCFVVLEGPPEMGKTTIARMIAIAQTTLKWDAIECRSPKELLDAWDTKRSQVFIADDFFGRSEYEPTRMREWEGELPYILDRIDKNHWLILTSRAHILKIGKRQLDVSGENNRFPHLGEVIVNAGDLNEIEKGKILYRHAKAADLSQIIRQHVRRRVKGIVANQHFTPLRIKNFVCALKSEPLE